MDFDLSEEQQLLSATIGRWASNAYPTLEAVQAARSERHGFSGKRWQELAELGILGLPFAEADGGIGGGPVETMLVMQALGRSLAPEPFLANVVLGAGALRLAGSAAQKDLLLPGIIAGETRIALAHEEAQARWDLFDVDTRAEKVGAGYRLKGAKRHILFGDGADSFVTSARTGGERRETAGITLFLVPANAVGLSVTGQDTQDGGRAAAITFDNVELPSDAIIGPVGGGLPILDQIAGQGIAALAAEAVGAMEALHELTIEYLKTRKQFGVAIGSFQSLQHKAVDMLVALEQARSMALYAAMMVNAADADERNTALSAVKVQINRSARFVGQTAVQLHGGIGMTMEYLGAHYFRRLAVIELMLGDANHHLERVAEAGGLVSAT